MRTLGAVLISLTLLLTACSGDDGHNDADVAFAQQMVPHHEQAVEMADLALENSSDDDVLSLARMIATEQSQEVRTLRSWLGEWDEDSMAGMDHSDMDGMRGMASDGDLADLAEARDAAFDELWLRLMIAHHEGAIEMAETVIDDGSSDEVKEFARTVIETQRTEVTRMEGLQ
ncbi:hypothetical protein HMPREF0063_10347 [Aeromicrobium marinum DSM 15272]|uniref:DUF305 domain-containing protein n=1 Tax=Aeromicrobium marinum DSM 15272 TaxID=585531 RepID=E2S8J0_9ACTN|nr:DUF305 domain-containing protein [Aeromicrobium marinum]EFQ84495.1 hypothetical protein HMPREF0063_10347 [Aeromicrobium marinum DSM 15272]